MTHVLTRPVTASFWQKRPWTALRNAFLAVGPLAIALVVALVLGRVAASGSLRIVVIAAGILVVPLLRSRALLTSCVLLICVLGLIRRLLSPGRVDYDPLLVLPLLLVVLAIALYRRPPDAFRGPRLQGALLAILCLWPVIAEGAVGGRTPAALYAVGLQVSCFLVIALTATGRLPDVWPAIYRWAPLVGLPLALYGLYQFYVLPNWDRQWMVASQLQSVGEPLPHLVRLFGASESPGPYAVVLTAVLLILLFRIRDAGGLFIRLALIGVLATVGYALLLTGVRTALGSIIASLLLLAVRFGSAKVGAGVAILGLGATAALARLTTSAADSGSVVLTSNRYDLSTITQDPSFKARTEILKLIQPGVHRPFGSGVNITGTQVGGIDNTYINLLVEFGPVAAVALLLLTVLTLKRVWSRGPVTRTSEYQALLAVTLSLIFGSFAGDIFATTTGLLAALVLGSFLKHSSQARISLLVGDLRVIDGDLEAELAPVAAGRQ